MGSGYSSEEDTRARDAHRTATILTLLVFLWGAIAVVFVPWEPFGLPNVAQIVVCGPLLAYLVRTWNRPRYRIAMCVNAIMIAFALLRLPWSAVMWSRLGRPLEAFAVPQLATVTIGLVFPGRWSYGALVMLLFTAEGLFAYFYARYLGLDALIPVTEPIATLMFTTLGFGLSLVRRRRRELVEQHVRARAELQALDRVRPLFAHARGELEAQVNVLAVEVRSTGARQAGAQTRVIDRALDRLSELGQTLGDLVATDEIEPSRQEAERQLLDRDAQLGAIMFAMLGAAFAIPVMLVFREHVGDVATPSFTVLFIVYGAMLAYLVITRGRPSLRRAQWVVIVLFATTLPIITSNQYLLLQADRPYAPFVGHKVLMGILGLTLAFRFKLGAVLIVVTAVSALGSWFALDLGAHKDIVESSEPFVMILYMVVGLASLRMGEQRQMASIQLLRDHAEASAMNRRAYMFLALRDRLNSPLQTLVLGAAGAIAYLPASGRERIESAIERLLVLSRELLAVDTVVPRGPISVDADQELRRRV